MLSSDALMAVVTVHGKTEETRVGNTAREYLVNYSDSSVKDWLTRTTVWCLANGSKMSLRGATDHDVATRRVFRPPYKEDRK